MTRIAAKVADPDREGFDVRGRERVSVPSEDTITQRAQRNPHPTRYRAEERPAQKKGAPERGHPGVARWRTDGRSGVLSHHAPCIS